MSTSSAPNSGVQVPPPVFFSIDDGNSVKHAVQCAYTASLNASKIAEMFGLDPVSALGIASMLQAAADLLYKEARKIRKKCKDALAFADDVVIPPSEAAAVLDALDATFKAEIGGGE